MQADTEFHPVTELNNYMFKIGRSAEIEWVENCTGPPHNPIWHIRCTVGSHGPFFGTGNKKMVAKNEAATNALIALGLITS
ncbi:hypothetical protein BOTBODRAFT_177872 [Botryobasidium botryosum FD-172 SS1]|uniref:DRBM domain-containing protein n=1 Tax=Botryobasidium botryosum (strain FD-172 SS1) TaxID=930990 RepID=A0A067M7X4_BOTB1|nr:hypothetical protein BOTBODRAFT_177872 [Botryobasidium botryosum FD-172 SS1]